MFNYKGRNVRQSQVEKFTRYSIRKVSFGAASVAVATGLFFLGGGSVQAAEQIANPEHAEVQKSQNLNDKSWNPLRKLLDKTLFLIKYLMCKTLLLLKSLLLTHKPVQLKLQME